MKQPLRYLFVDFDAWFASVEEALNPSLKGKPIGIVPVMTERTCCIATNYAAKRLGISTGTAVWEAKKICPDIVLVPSQTERYVYYHHAMVEAIGRCAPVGQVLSIDELFCELTGHWRNVNVAQKISLQIKQAVRQVLDVTCSIGVSSNVFLAKMASKLDKPDGLRILYPEQLPQAFSSFKISDITGIGRRMEQRLLNVGVTSIADLYALNQRQVHNLWGGIEGDRLYAELRGFEVHRPKPKRSSVGHSHVLPPQHRQADKALAITHKMLHKAAFRMRQLQYHAQGLRLSIRLPKKPNAPTSWSQQVQFSACNSTPELTRQLDRLWQRRPPSQHIIASSVQLYNLLPDISISQDLFAQSNQEKSSLLADQINRKFGAQSIYFGSAKDGLDGAPMRISFTQIPDLKLESDR